jgi:hypothetical protein
MTGAPGNNEIDTIKSYVEAATAASDRGRLVLLVTITISVLAFSAYWNARQESWLNSRLHMARLGDLACAKGWDIPKITEPLTDSDKLMIQQAHEYYTTRHFDGCDHLAEVVKSLQEIQAKDVNQVKMPFFGAQFDVNDLGMFAGFAFVVALIWFRYSLAREYNNLDLCFRVAFLQSAHDSKTCYNLLAMRQVMTIPPPLEEDPLRLVRHHSGKTARTLRFVRNHLSLLLYVLPLVVQFLIVQSDVRTLALGKSASVVNQRVVTWAELLFLVSILLLTIFCLSLALRIDRKWEETAKDLRAATKGQH